MQGRCIISFLKIKKFLLGEFSLDRFFRSAGIFIGNGFCILLHILVIIWAPVFSHLFLQFSLFWWFILLDLHFDNLRLFGKFFLLFFDLFKFRLHFCLGVHWFLFFRFLFIVVINWFAILIIRICFVVGNFRFLLCGSLFLSWIYNICFIIFFVILLFLFLDMFDHLFLSLVDGGLWSSNWSWGCDLYRFQGIFFLWFFIFAVDSLWLKPILFLLLLFIIEWSLIFSFCFVGGLGNISLGNHRGGRLIKFRSGVLVLRDILLGDNWLILLSWSFNDRGLVSRLFDAGIFLSCFVQSWRLSRVG